MLEKLDILPGYKTLLVVVAFIGLNLANKYVGVGDIDVSLVNNILYALGLGTIRLAIERK